MINQQKIEVLLKKCLQMAQVNIQAGKGGPFAAIICDKDGNVIAEATNQVTTKNDPTAHAEIEAIRIAALKINNFSLSNHILFSSCEPCPMCLSAALWARVDAVYYAAGRHDAAKAGFDDVKFYKTICNTSETSDTLMKQYKLPSEVKNLFELWQQKSDKTIY